MFKSFIALGLLLASVMAHAEAYLVYQYNQSTRVVLSNNSCLVNGLTGNRAAIQRNDGRHLRGCWQFVDNDQHVRIDWENPAKPKDFAVLRVRDFTSVVE